MKKIFSLLIAGLLVVFGLTACSSKLKGHTEAEQKVVKTANELVAKKYNVTLNEDQFSYSVGKQISETEYVELDSKEIQDPEFKDIVSVSALKKNPAKDGDVYSYTVTFNQKTNEIKNISIQK